MKFAPNTLFSLASLAFVIALGACIWLTTLGPWLGFRWGAAGMDARSLPVVQWIDPAGPAAGLISVGDGLLALRGPHGEELSLAAASLRSESGEARDFEQLSDRARSLDAVSRWHRSGSVELRLADGRVFPIVPSSRRAIDTLSGRFWIQLVSAGVAFLVSVGVWAFRPRGAVAYFATSGISLTAATLLAATLAESPLALNGEWNERLRLLTHLAENFFVTGLVALCWVYPRPLRGSRAVPLLFLVPPMIAIGDGLRILPNAHWGAHWPQIAGVAAIAFTMYLQVRASGDHADRDNFLWLAVPILLGMGAFLSLHSIPVIIREQPLVPRFVSAVTLAAIYLGLAAGMYRRGLFSVDRWFFAAWLLFAGLLLLLVMDAALVSALHLKRDASIVAALAALAWLYLPLRQWLWRLITRETTQEEFRGPFTDLLRLGLSQDASFNDEERWRLLLGRRFAPLHVRELISEPHGSELADGGAEMHIPSFAEIRALALCHADRGDRLFNYGDLREADLLLRLFSRILEFRAAAAVGAAEERRRVAQDLHDDLVPPLLSFIYRADDPDRAQAGRSAMRKLRQAIRELAETP